MTTTITTEQALDIAKLAVQQYAQTHPRPIHVTQKQAANMLGMSEPTMKKLIDSGQIKLNKAGRIPVAEVDQFAQLQSS